MESGGSMQHSQGLSNNSYPEPSQFHVHFFIVMVVPNHQSSSEALCDVSEQR